MPEELTVTACPRCGSIERVRSKLITTNFLLQSHFVEPFTVDRPSQFRASPHTLGDYFVAGLFCDHCDLGFVPDSVAHEIGIEPCRYRGQIALAPRNYGIGYPRSDVSYDEQGRAMMSRVEPCALLRPLSGSAHPTRLGFECLYRQPTSLKPIAS